MLLASHLSIAHRMGMGFCPSLFPQPSSLEPLDNTKQKAGLQPWPVHWELGCEDQEEGGKALSAAPAKWQCAVSQTSWAKVPDSSVNTVLMLTD